MPFLALCHLHYLGMDKLPAFVPFYCIVFLVFLPFLPFPFLSFPYPFSFSLQPSLLGMDKVLALFNFLFSPF